VTTRRQFFGYAGAAAAGAAATGGAVVALDNNSDTGTPVARTISPYGDHQAGIARSAPAVAELVSFKLGTDQAGLGRLMRLWTSDLVALADGRAAPGDTAPELAVAN
jgi:dye decolorizing peroxidase